MERRQPNWVAERTKCNMATLLQDISHLVQECVDDMNKELEKEQQSLRFRYIPRQTAPPTFEIEGKDTVGTILGCQFQYEPKTDKIAVRSSVKDSQIGTRWDAEEIQCRVVISSSPDDPVEFPHSQLWKAVQYLLEPFFFPTTHVS